MNLFLINYSSVECRVFLFFIFYFLLTAVDYILLYNTIVSFFSRAGRASLKCFRVSRLWAFFNPIASCVFAQVFEKKFAHSRLRVIAHCVCLFNFAVLIFAPPPPLASVPHSSCRGDYYFAYVCLKSSDSIL